MRRLQRRVHQPAAVVKEVRFVFNMHYIYVVE